MTSKNMINWYATFENAEESWSNYLCSLCTQDQHKSSEAQRKQYEFLNTCKNQDTSIAQSYTLAQICKIRAIAIMFLSGNLIYQEK